MLPFHIENICIIANYLLVSIKLEVKFDKLYCVYCMILNLPFSLYRFLMDELPLDTNWPINPGVCFMSDSFKATVQKT